jgi:uncharacterized FlaG/YvyC family protein
MKTTSNQTKNANSKSNQEMTAFGKKLQSSFDKASQSLYVTVLEMIG